MKSVNKSILIGNLGKDPEIRQTPNGHTVAKFSLATTEGFKKNDEWQEKTEWHNVVLWGRLAEIAQEYAHKGTRVYVEGRLQTSSWEDKTSGQKRYMTEVIGDSFMLLDGKRDGWVVSNAEPEPASLATDAISDDDIPF